MNLQKHISSSIRHLLLEECYCNSLSENEGLKNVWMRKFKDVIKDKNSEVIHQKGFWAAAEMLYSKGLPATHAAEQMFTRTPQGNPMPRDFPRGTGGWGHK